MGIRAKRLGVMTPLLQCAGQGNDFQLIPTIKMETRHPIEIYFSREYAAICHHICELTAAVVQTGGWLKPRSLSVSNQDFSANTTSQSGVRHFYALAGGDSLRRSP